MTQLIFLENEAQVRWAERVLPRDANTKVIAVTADAAQALEACGRPHEVVSAFADVRKLAAVEAQFTRDSVALVEEIESFLAERYAPARFDGPGFLTGLGYYLQNSVCAVATRAFLMRETIRACAPDRVAVCQDAVDPWFEGDGYRRNPWLEVIEDLGQADGFKFETLEAAASEPRRGRAGANGVWGRAYRYARRKLSHFLRERAEPPLPPLASPNDLAGLRLLLVEGSGYDWAPPLAALRSVKGAECFGLAAACLDDRWWTQYYVPSARRVWGGRHCKFVDVGLPSVEVGELRHLDDVFDDWLKHRPSSTTLNVLGMNLFPALVPHLRALTILGPSLARHADAVAVRALDAVKPDAVCFFGMPLLPAKRLAHHCRKRGVPVVCYQHGGAYGTHVVPLHELLELGHADYFLTYGEGIRPPAAPALPIRAKFVPVGSARIEAMTARPAKRKRHPGLTVLWIAEVSFRNTVGGTFLVEDTARYSLQKQCLELLGQATGLHIIYRPAPYRPAWQATPRWLSQAGLRAIRVNSTQPIDDLIRRSDLVISDTFGGTAWNEVLALHKPLILYCDPKQISLMPHFVVDLEQACHWCKSKEELVEAVHRLVVDGDKFVSELRTIDPTTFVRNYVLHEGQCMPRVLSFLNMVCRNKQSVDNWESSMVDHRVVT